MSPQNLYFRFFSLSRLAAERKPAGCAARPAHHGALLGLLGDELVGVASYELLSGLQVAEIALAVADGMHERECHIAARAHGLAGPGLRREGPHRGGAAGQQRRATAARRLGAGCAAQVRRRHGGAVHAGAAEPGPRRGQRLPRRGGRPETNMRMRRAWNLCWLPGRPRWSARSAAPDQLAGGSCSTSAAPASPVPCMQLTPMRVPCKRLARLPPASRASRASRRWLRCPRLPTWWWWRSRAARVVDAAQECGKRGSRSLVVVTLGLTAAQESSLLEASRRAGMRLVGPDCLGVAVPGIGLNATFATRPPSPGRACLAVQSGGVGAALLEHFSRLGIGTSSFASVGGMLDVCGTDMLMWWEADDTTELAVLYLESFGNPRRFARTARRVSAKVPILTVHACGSAPGQRAAISAHRSRGRAAHHPAGTVRSGGHYRHHQLQRTAGRGRADRVPAGPGGQLCGHRVQRRRRGRAGRRRLRRSRPGHCRAGLGRPAAACGRRCPTAPPSAAR